MHKQTYILLAALALVTAAVAVALFVSRGNSTVPPSPVDTGTPPTTRPFATSTSTGTTSEMWFDPDSNYVGDYPKSPFIEPDPKLHIYADMTLDPKIITINYQLKDISLCGNTYKTKQIFIDGVDVMQRLVQLLDADTAKKDWYCDKLKARTRDSGGILDTGEEIHIFIATDGTNYSFAPGMGVDWDGGYPIYVLPEENKLVGHIGYLFGTLR